MRGRERERLDDERGPCPAIGCKGDKRRSMLACHQDWSRLRAPEKRVYEEAVRRFKLEHTREAAAELRSAQEWALALINMRIGLAAAKEVRLPGSRRVRRTRGRRAYVS